MPHTLKSEQDLHVRAKVCLDFAGLIVHKVSASSASGGSAAGKGKQHHAGLPQTRAWLEELSEEEKESEMMGQYLDATPVVSTLACLEEVITVLGGENVFLVVYGKNCLREKNWIDYRGLWSLGLRKENVLLCPQPSEVGKTLQAAGISVFFSTSPAAIASAAETLPSPSLSAPSSNSDKQGPNSPAPVPEVYPLLLGLFRGQGVASSSLRAALPIDKFSSTGTGTGIVVKYVFDDFADDSRNGLEAQWGSAMKLMAEKGLPPMRLRAFESKTIHWMTQEGSAPASSSSFSSELSGGSSSSSSHSPSPSPRLLPHKEEESSSPFPKKLSGNDGEDEEAVTWWRLLKGVVFREEHVPDLSDELRSGDDPAEDLLYYEGDRSNWSWWEVFGQLLHSDNTVAISTVCGCKDEKDVGPGGAAST